VVRRAGASGQTLRMPPQRSEASVVAFLAFLGVMAAFGVGASLPAFDEIRRDVGLDPGSNRITLMITVYLIGNALGQVLCGPFADRFGRAPVLRAGLVIAALGIAGTISSQGLPTLLASRLLWGLGNGAPANMRATVARDLYLGDHMARVVSRVMGFFLLGPILVPLLVEGILAVGSWRTVFTVGLALAGVGTVWSFRFGETLDPVDRRPLGWAATGEAFHQILKNRTTVGYLVALTFTGAAFFIWLGSSQPVFDLVYGRADQFAVMFSASGVVTAVGFFSVGWFINRYGAHRVAVSSIGMVLVLNIALVALVARGGGRPSFWGWFILLTASNVFLGMVVPTGLALALRPLGSIAGTAAGVIGACSMAGSAVLAALVDTRISTTITPMAVGYLLYGTLALAGALWARPSGGGHRGDADSGVGFHADGPTPSSFA
jgi:DHA1 family bicyclomycin/chloramphenicol resistance-like MFS transporter